MPNIRTLIAILILLNTGCITRGRLYTKVTIPYSTDFCITSVGSKTCRINEHRLKEPFSGAGITAQWTSRAIALASRESGMTSIHFADLETFSILDGIYLKRTLILYGD